jgi:hypothetical protein
MLQKEVIDTIAPVDSGWVGSIIHIPNHIDNESLSVSVTQIDTPLYKLLFLLSIIVLIVSLFIVYKSRFQKKNIPIGIVSLFSLFVCPLLPYILIQFGIFPDLSINSPSFFFVVLKSFVILYSFIIFKIIVICLIRWVVGDELFADKFITLIYISLVSIFALWLLLMLLINIFHITNLLAIRYSLIILSSVVLVPYYILIIRTFILSKFPIFFSFLYLCTLEILPLIVTIHFLISFQ